MSSQTAQWVPAPLSARIVPRRPQRRDLATQRPAEAPQEVGNLFGDLFDTPAAPALSRGEAARVRALRMIEAASHQDQSRGEAANLWAEPLPPAPRVLSQPQTDLATRALRQALCAPTEVAPDTPATAAERDRIRLAVHAMNTTLTIAYPPVGAVVMTYTFLRGESMRLTARSMVMMGMVMTLLHGQLPGL